MIEKVKYVIWAKEMAASLSFYKKLGAEIGVENPAGCTVKLAGSEIFVHSGGEGKRTWTGLTFVVGDIREVAKRVEEAGGELLKAIEDTPEEPAHLAYCADPAGNEFMLSLRR